MLESTGLEKPAERLALCADAFLFTGALFLVTQGFLGIIMVTLRSFGIEIAMDIPSQLFMIASLLAGILVAWRMHAHLIRGRVWLYMIAGILISGTLMIAAFFAFMSLGRFIPNPVPEVEGPWGAVVVLLLAVVAFLVKPVINAVRDLFPGKRAHIRLDLMRLGALVVIVAAVIATTVYGISTGSEVAEAGIFMVPVAAAAACVALVIDLFETLRNKKRPV